LTYQSINKLLSETEETTVALNIPKLNIALEELFFFQPQLSENKYLNILAKKPLSGNINAKGTLAKINIPNTHILWGDSTKIEVKGTLSSVLDVNRLQLNLDPFTIVSNNADIYKFLSKEQLGIAIPKKISLKGTLNGS